MENKNTFAICIPTLNRFDLLLPSLLLYAIDFPNTKIFILDNGNQGIHEKLNVISEACNYYGSEWYIVMTSENNNGVAWSWNLLCNVVFKEHDYALVLNDDIYLGKKEWEIVSLIRNKRFLSDLYLPEQDWSAFILPKATFDKVGKFDEKFFPAYYEDNDMERRIALAGMEVTKIPFLNPVIYRNSMTLERDPNLLEGYKKKNAQKNAQYYLEKWGGEPGKEVFTIPFNIKS